MIINKVIAVRNNPNYNNSYDIVPSFYSFTKSKEENKQWYLENVLFNNKDDLDRFISKDANLTLNKNNFLTAEVTFDYYYYLQYQINLHNCNYVIAFDETNQNWLGYFVSKRIFRNVNKIHFELELDIWFSYWNKVSFLKDNYLFISRKHVDRFSIKDGKLTNKILTDDGKYFWNNDKVNVDLGTLNIISTEKFVNSWDINPPIYGKIINQDNQKPGQAVIVSADDFTYQGWFIYALIAPINNEFEFRDVYTTDSPWASRVYSKTDRLVDLRGGLNFTKWLINPKKIEGNIVSTNLLPYTVAYNLPYKIMPIFLNDFIKFPNSKEITRIGGLVGSNTYTTIANSPQLITFIVSYVPIGLPPKTPIPTDLAFVNNFTNNEILLDSKLGLYNNSKNFIQYIGNIPSQTGFQDFYIQTLTIDVVLTEYTDANNNKYKQYTEINLSKIFPNLWKDKELFTITNKDELNLDLQPNLYNGDNCKLNINFFGQKDYAVFFNYLQDVKITMDVELFLFPYISGNLFKVKNGLYGKDETLDATYFLGGDLTTPSNKVEYLQFKQTQGANFNTSIGNAKREYYYNQAQTLANTILHPLKAMFDPKGDAKTALNVMQNKMQYENQLRKFDATRKDLMSTPNAVGNVPELESLFKILNNKEMMCKIYWLTNQYRERIARNYHYNGYIINERGTIGDELSFFMSRINFDYIICDLINNCIIKNIPIEIIDGLENLFKHGLTLMHFNGDSYNPNNFNYENWEASIWKLMKKSD